MPVRVIIPTPLRQYAEKQESIEVDAGTVGQALAHLAEHYDGLRKHLYNDEGKLRSFVNVYVGDERYSLPAEGTNPAKTRRCNSDCALHRRRRRF